MRWGWQGTDPGPMLPPLAAGLGAGPPPRLQPPQGALLRRLQPRGRQLVPTGPLAPHPHPRRLWRQAHPGGPEERSSPHRERGSPLFLAPPLGVEEGGGGVAAPQPRCRGAQPRCCGNRFQANRWLLPPRSGSLAHWRPPSPSRPSSLRCGLGEGLAGAGVRGSDPGPGRGAGRGEGLSPGTIFRPRSGPARPAAAVLTGPGILLELVLLARSERRGPHGQSPRPGGGGGGPWELTVAAKAAPSAGLEPRGARTGAYTARTEPGVRARGSWQRAPTHCHSPPRRLSQERKAEVLALTCHTESRQAGRRSHPAKGMPVPRRTALGNRLSGPGTRWQTRCTRSWVAHTRC